MTEINQNSVQASDDGLPCRKVKESDAVYIAMETGERMLNCGGEVGRVEDTINRICTAYGAQNVDVTVIMSLIVLSVDFGGEAITVTRRIVGGTSTNLARFSLLNDLSRRICKELPSREDFEKNIADIDKKSELKSFKYLLGSVFAAAGFAVFFGGGLLDAIFSGIIALPMMILLGMLGKARLNAIVAKLIVCFAGGVVALLVGKLGLGCNVNMIMIGNIMNVIPGVALTISLRDLISGDIMTGVFRLSAVIVDAVTIACGYALAILLFGGVV